jgi:hypothetical protein
VTLQRFDHEARIHIDMRQREKVRDRAQRKRLEDQCLHQLVETLRLSVYGKDHYDVHIIRYPATWWDAVKERFAPAWLLYQWPAKFITIKASLRETYPDFQPALPDHPPVLKFAVTKTPEYPIW